MAPSQLKSLKKSLREQGVVGQQKSKKRRKESSDGGALRESRIHKNAALHSIREQFNPFDVKTAVNKKFEFIKSRGSGADKPAIMRPGITKGLGEENRRKTLLVEMERRKKVGGIMDRRFGEDDPKMTPEERALQRYIREKQRGSKKDAIFDLEDGETFDSLTHSGQALDFSSSTASDDFNEADVEESDLSKSQENTEGLIKERRLSRFDEELNGLSERPKTKHEIMKEVIAKSKLHKYERQQTKEDDDELRAELDKGLPDLFALMRDTHPQAAIADPINKAQVASINPERLALLNGKDRLQADQEYDQRLRQMALDQRAKPTVRTLPEEERIRLESQRLRDMEEARLRRMRGSREDSGSEGSGHAEINGKGDDNDDEESDAFGLGKGLAGRQIVQGLGIEDEDDFLIDEDLVASESEAKLTDSESQSTSDEELSEDADAALVHDLITQEDLGRDGLSFAVSADGASEARETDGGLAYTYPCPQTLEEMLSITHDLHFEGIPTVVQRIRILYQPQNASQNKASLERFTAVLVAYIAHMANQSNHPPFTVLEALVRHLHSLAKTFPEEAGRAFRSHLRAMNADRPTSPNAGDLVILTAVGSIFPTSDHFHQVVTPAMLCMTRYLGQKIPSSLSDLAVGAYICNLCLHFQILSKRYLPEVVNYVLNTLDGLMPQQHGFLNYPAHVLPPRLQISPTTSHDVVARQRLTFWDVLPRESITKSQRQSLRYALLSSQLALIDAMSHAWAEMSAFCELFDPIYSSLHGMKDDARHKDLPGWLNKDLHHACEQLHQLLANSSEARKSLCLHHHRPLAIKSSIPKFEESYNPDRHYDPDRDRAEMSKLKAEHKRERKGALRELRKDASFIARESLREKKEKDSAYEKKYKRLVAEIQGEEGREAKSYEREKRARKSKR